MVSARVDSAAAADVDIPRAPRPVSVSRRNEVAPPPAGLRRARRPGRRGRAPGRARGPRLHPGRRVRRARGARRRSEKGRQGRLRRGGVGPRVASELRPAEPPVRPPAPRRRREPRRGDAGLRRDGVGRPLRALVAAGLLGLPHGGQARRARRRPRAEPRRAAGRVRDRARVAGRVGRGVARLRRLGTSARRARVGSGALGARLDVRDVRRGPDRTRRRRNLSAKFRLG